MKQFLLLMIVIFCSPMFGQEQLYLPLEFQKAYENETRSKDGSVPEGYWQNRAVYNIVASVDPETKILRGSAAITYFNNSPDTLSSVTFHSYHDYLKPYTSRQYHDPLHSPAGDHKGMLIDLLIVAGDTVDIADPERVMYRGTNYGVSLTKPLPPNEQLNLEIDWNYEIPDERQVRSGAFDSTSMFVAYWYPEIAVRDDIHGWDTKAFDTNTEFYHDFSDYNVVLSLPEEFTVWASVPPDNPEEVYPEEVQDRLEQARNSSSGVQILTKEDFISGSGGTKTWKYTAKEFPDFSFALSDHFLWEASTYKDEEGEYFIQTAYSEENPAFGEILPMLASSLETFHRDFPQYPFPYKYFTVFHGDKLWGGMEFPGMANNGHLTAELYKQNFGVDPTEEQIDLGNNIVTLHEMAHMYFPFMMGINEKKYAWMDEGFAMASEAFTDEWLPLNDFDFSFLGSLSTVPPMVPSDEHDNSATNAYIVGGAAYLSLYELLGDELFHRGLHAFMDEWKYKHPTPYDLMFTFNKATGKDLTWFWNAWYFDWGYMDIGIEAVEGRTVKIENPGGKPMTFKIVTIFENGEIIQEQISPAVWENSSGYTYSIPGSLPVTEVRLQFFNYPDAVNANNLWKRGE